MSKIFLIGGGELRQMSELNELIVRSAGIEGRKPIALFFPQASNESKPYVNSFVKEFGSRLKCKATCALWRLGEMDRVRIAEKIAMADIIYIGGGKYDRLLAEFEAMGIKELLDKAILSDKVIVGNSAGAMLMTEHAVSDYMLNSDGTGDYTLVDGYGYIKGTFTPHYDEPLRQEYISRCDIVCDYITVPYEYLEFDI